MEEKIKRFAVVIQLDYKGIIPSKSTAKDSIRWQVRLKSRIMEGNKETRPKMINSKTGSSAQSIVSSA